MRLSCQLTLQLTILSLGVTALCNPVPCHCVLQLKPLALQPETVGPSLQSTLQGAASLCALPIGTFGNSACGSAFRIGPIHAARARPPRPCNGARAVPTRSPWAYHFIKGMGRQGRGRRGWKNVWAGRRAHFRCCRTDAGPYVQSP